jgi:S-DNA-T family DNA segregation ATPase FtsK/SpoIIIE
MSGERAEGQLLPKVYAEPMVAGRGRLVRRGERPTLVQIARFETATAVADAGAVPLTRRRRRADTP